MTAQRGAGTIAPLDGLRGIAVLWVILFHFVALRHGVEPPRLGTAGGHGSNNRC